MQPFDKEYVCDIAKQILNIDSPTGYTKRAIDFMDEEAKKLREKLNIEMNTPESFFIVKEILDRYDNTSKLHQPTAISQRELLLDFAEYSENDKTSTAIDECVDNYLDSIKQ